MYAQFFGLKQEPFSIAPDPRYLFMSERHREALAHLLYGVRGGGGFVLLSGEIGAGKTTVCRCFLEQIPKHCNVAYIFNPKLTATELLKSVCDEFHVPYTHQGPGVATVKDYIDPLNEFLLKTHAVRQNNILIIDEAQNLSAEVLEQLRLLTNLETNERKLLQIILIGQPELRAMLARPELEQLAQRVIARFHLDALSEAETVQYVQHRLAVAGASAALPLFDGAALRRIHRVARGVPRRINLLCDRALLGAYANGRNQVDRRIVDRAAREVFDANPPARERAFIPARWAAFGGLGLAAGAVLFGIATLAMDGRAHRTAAPNAKPAQAPQAASAAPASAASGGAGGLSLAAVATAGELRAALAASRSENEAWRELAQAWKLALPAEGDPCLAAQKVQLLCYRSGAITGLALIRELGRPGILTLHDEASGKTGYALLTGLDERSASLRLGGMTRRVDLGVLAGLWRGDFATLWRAPQGYAGVLAQGSSGAAVDALAAELAKSRGEAAPAGAQTYDAALRARVYAFQLAQGLKPDGVAGPTTLMQLNRVSGVDEPRLK